MDRCCKKHEVIKMNKLNGWPFEPFRRDFVFFSGIGDGPGPGPN